MATNVTRGRGERRPGGATPNVLVVDDEADIRELLELSLIRMGLDVETAGSLREAHEKLAAHSFDLCLTDMRLPDGEGLDLVRHISANSADLPVAVITAFGTSPPRRSGSRSRCTPATRPSWSGPRGSATTSPCRSS